MPRPSPPSVREIQRVADERTFQRGCGYHRGGRVFAGTCDDVEITATVSGSRARAYEVEIDLVDGMVDGAGCTCPMGGWCKHVVATLLAYRDNPDAWSEGTHDGATPLGGQDFADAASVRTWAAEHGVADLLDSPAQAAVTNRSMRQYYAESQTILQVLFPKREGRHSYLWDLDRRTATEIATWLRTEASRREAVRAHNAAAQELRRTPPVEPSLAALHAWLVPAAKLDRVDTRGPAGPFGGYETLDDPPQVTIRVPGSPTQAVPLHPGDDACGLDTGVARAALDLLVHPELAETKIRSWAAKQAAIPEWTRTLAALEGALALAVAPDPDGREVGWRVTLDRGLAVDAVWCRPYKAKPGLRTWNRKPTQGRRSPRDRAAARVLIDVRYHVNASRLAVMALAELVDHPRVVLGRGGQPVAVRTAQLLVDWVPDDDDGGLRLVVLLDGVEVGSDALGQALTQHGDDQIAFVQPDRARILIVPCPRETQGLLNQIVTRSCRFPAEARPALLERFEALRTVAPMRLVGELRGTRVACDARPVVRLLPGPDGALELDLRVRPLPEGPVCVPGEGVDTLAVVREGARVFVERVLTDEEAVVRALATDLGLPEQGGFTWVLTDPEAALPVVEALQHRPELQVEWARPRVRVTRATAKQLTVQGKPRRDWFGLEGGIEVGGKTAELADLLAAVRGGKRFVRLGDTGWARITDELAGQLRAVAGVGWTGPHGVEIPPLAATMLDEVGRAGAKVELPEVWRVREHRIREAATLDVEVPDTLHATLRAYQVDGFRWLARLAHWAPGAVLADDMGLGKTVQALCLMLRRASTGPALVVAPASVGLNWLREAERFTPSLRVRSYRGRDRAEMLVDAGPSDVLVTSWELMTRDADALAAVGFQTVVLDEAQAIKNPATRRSKASARLGGGFTLALTGTPVENRVGEVWSLFRTVVPGLFGSADRFRHGFVGPIERDGDGGARFALASVMRPFLLRRRKSEVARELPERSEVEVHIELNREERALYDTLRDATVAALQGPSEGADQRFRILAAMTRLRQLACDPRLVYPDRGLGRSSKVERLVRTMVDLRDNGHKALVFSQFTTLLDLARTALREAGLQLRYLDGSTPVARRQEQVDAFQDGDGDCFLISLKAGGTGLNLTAADYVIHLDPWWNPAVEDQATDRAHRIGQTRPVTVYRFVARDTIEDAVLAMHAEKRALMADLLQGTSRAAPLSASELLGMLQGRAPDLLADFEHALRAELASGSLKREVTVRHYHRAAVRLVAWARAQGGAIRGADTLEHWSEQYLAALASGALTEGRSDKVFGPPAFKRLRVLIEGRAPPS